MVLILQNYIFPQGKGIFVALPIGFIVAESAPERLDRIGLIVGQM